MSTDWMIHEIIYPHDKIKFHIADTRDMQSIEKVSFIRILTDEWGPD